MNVCYIGPFFDYSGYGEANRHAAAALDAAGVNVKADLVSYVRDQADFGELGKTIQRLVENQIDYKVKILHTTPDQYQKYVEPGKYHIGHFFWETSRVPQQFVEGLQLMDEIWTGSEYNKQAIERSGVNRPVFVFPQATETGRPVEQPYRIPNFQGFLFYSVFEWTDRKNPEALLRAFWEEFQGNEKVGLLIKTYFKDFSRRSKDLVRDSINQLKRKSGLSNFPQVFVFPELMDRHQIQRLHATGDCFVSAHRGEGWGIPQVEALLQAKPVISTDCGGVHEYLRDDDTALLVPWTSVKVSGMAHSNFWYTADQTWAEVDHTELRKKLRWVFENSKQAKGIGMRGCMLANDRFNLKRVGEEMKARLLMIEEKLG